MEKNPKVSKIKFLEMDLILITNVQSRMATRVETAQDYILILCKSDANLKL